MSHFLHRRESVMSNLRNSETVSRDLNWKSPWKRKRRPQLWHLSWVINHHTVKTQTHKAWYIAKIVDRNEKKRHRLEKEPSEVVIIKPTVKHNIHCWCSFLQWVIKIEMIVRLSGITARQWVLRYTGSSTDTKSITFIIIQSAIVVIYENQA